MPVAGGSPQVQCVLFGCARQFLMHLLVGRAFQTTAHCMIQERERPRLQLATGQRCRHLNSTSTHPAPALMHTRGIEPRSQAWKACMMPLHYVCCIWSAIAVFELFFSLFFVGGAFEFCLGANPCVAQKLHKFPPPGLEPGSLG